MAAQKLTSKQIKPIVADYRTALPEWQLVGDDLLLRLSGPVAQVIWFDRLRTGAYRPTCRVHVLSAPSQEGGIAVLPQFLNIKVREIMPAAHAQLLPAVIGALKSEVLPSVIKALDARVVVELLQDRASGRPANAYALACLFGVLGRADDMARWVKEYHSAVAGLGLPVQPVDAERGDFLRKAEEWMNQPERDARFAEVVAQQTALMLQGKA